MDGTAKLIKESGYTKDAIGQRIPSETTREIFCEEKSVGQQEYYNAGQYGLTAELVLVTPAVNYEGERIIDYEGKRYGIYRTYRNPKSDDIELYLAKKGGLDESQN